MKKKIKNILYRAEYILPILLLILINYHYLFLNDILGNILLALVFISLTQVFRTIKSLYISIDILLVVLFNTMMGLQLGHFYLFGGNLRPSTFFIVFDSNNAEAFDFLSMYFDFKLGLLFTSLLFGIIIGFILRIKNEHYKKEIKFTKKTKIILAGCILTLFLIKEVRHKVFPYMVYNAFTEYSEEKIKFDAVTQDPNGGQFSDVIHNSEKNDEVYVLIIGESTTKHHMQLYGYNRTNNQRLNTIKNDLLIYKDVISPHTRTLESLRKVLTLSDFKHPNRKYDGTIIQLFNKAGFKTYWISNQAAMGVFDTETTIIAKNCQRTIFVGTQGTLELSFDERIVKPMDEILRTEKGKKLIVLHLMGAHGDYRKRYPNSFEVFEGKPNIRFKSKKAFKLTNQYDNAILYNDYVVSEVIKKIKNHTQDKKAFVLYFSDHGEELYESMDLAGHNDEHCTKWMYDIPFVLWQSSKYKESNTDLVFDTNRPYCTEDMLYTLSDLSGIYFKEFDSTKSIVNKNFIAKKRMILNGVDYNEHFKVKK